MNTYCAEDLARIAPHNCEGCGECCRGMGDTIHIDPWDIMMLTSHLHMTFMELLDRDLDLRVEDGLLLPNLAINDDHPVCPFLDESLRCTIHDFRPGICRLFPLGREYSGNGFHYILTEGQCTRKKYKVKIKKYLDIPDLNSYETFIGEWHAFIRKEQRRMQGTMDISEKQTRNMEFLKTFYMTPYHPEMFYKEIRERLKNANVMLADA